MEHLDCLHRPHLYSSVKDSNFLVYKNSSLACFLATKVIYANEMYDICVKLGIKYEEVKKMVVADRRIYDSHLDVTSLRGFGGKCFPKDLLALLAMVKSNGVDTTLLDAVWRKNLKIRKVHDWEEIPFVVSKRAKKSA